MKIIAHCDYMSLAVAGISTYNRRPDCDEGHFSFIVYSIDPLDFANAIEECVNQRLEQKTYYDVQEIVLRACRSYDTIRIVRECSSLTITRGNMKVLYYGTVDTLNSLPKVIRKAVAKRNKEEGEIDEHHHS